MKNWLVKHAIDNIWCHPATDRRWIVKPGRQSMPQGQRFGMTVMGYNIRFPDGKKFYHLFQLNAMPHIELGIEYLNDQWMRLDKILNAYGTLITLYNEEGRTFPLEYSWIRKLPNRGVIVCVEEVTGQTDFGHDDLFIRFYNGYFRNSEKYSDEYKSETYGQIIRNASERFDVLRRYREMQGREGYVHAYVNGYEVERLDNNTVAIWDYVELVRDGLVKDVYHIEMNEVSSFMSELDQRSKYLIHLPKGDDDNTIEFINDVDLYIHNDNDGRYYHRHQSESLRQVTHRDYSIPANRLTTYCTNIAGWNDVRELTIKVVTRHSGMERPIVFTHDRILELYKLDDRQIVDALCGMNSSVSEWRAANLESSSYVKIMASMATNITNELCTDAYGYHAITRYAADTPTKTRFIGGVKQALLPPYLVPNCTVYEYDSSGKLLGFYPHQGQVDDYYHCRNQNCELVEVIAGRGGKILDINWDAKNYHCNPEHNYRFYTNRLKSGVETDDFVDITDTDAYHIENDGRVVWSGVDLQRRVPIVWSDTRFLAYSFVGRLWEGDLDFTIDHWVDESTWYPLEFCPETLEIWMNGHALVPGIDYIVNYPKVVICNKSYLTNDANRDEPIITVRARGLASELRTPKTGYVINGLVSNNARYDIRDDQVVRITVDGALHHREDVLFREGMNTANVGDSLNGKPYAIWNATIPLRGLVSENTYVMRDRSRNLDTRIEDYLSVFIPTPVLEDLNPIYGHHHLFSPIMNKVIADIKRGVLTPVNDDETFMISTAQFDRLMEPYIYLLRFDPALLGVDQKYCGIHPHSSYSRIELAPLEFLLIEKINDRYMNNHVVLNQHLFVKG